MNLVVLAGEQYRTALRDSPWPYEVPMKGLGIGQQHARTVSSCFLTVEQATQGLNVGDAAKLFHS